MQLFTFYHVIPQKQDIRKEIGKIAAFLNKTITDEQMEKLVDHVRVDKFSKNQSVNMTMEIKSGFTNEGHSFVRKGQASIRNLKIYLINGSHLIYQLINWCHLNDRSNWRLEKSFQPRTQPENWWVDQQESNGVRLEICYRARQARLKTILVHQIHLYR